MGPNESAHGWTAFWKLRSSLMVSSQHSCLGPQRIHSFVRLFAVQTSWWKDGLDRRAVSALLPQCTETWGPRALSCRVGDGPVLADARIIVTVSDIFSTKGHYLTSSGMEELPSEEWDLIVHQKLHQVLSCTTFYSSQQRDKNSSPQDFPSASPAASPVPRPQPKTDCSILTALLVRMTAWLAIVKLSFISNGKWKIGMINRHCNF